MEQQDLTREAKAYEVIKLSINYLKSLATDLEQSEKEYEIQGTGAQIAAVGRTLTYIGDKLVGKITASETTQALTEIQQAALNDLYEIFVGGKAWWLLKTKSCGP